MLTRANKVRNCLSLLLLFFGAFILHLTIGNVASILIYINETFGRVLSICGINGVYVTEKPDYMFPLYILCVFFMIAVACAATFLIQKLLVEIVCKS